MLPPWNKPACLAVDTDRVTAWAALPGKPVAKVCVPLLSESDADESADANADAREQYRGLSAAIRNAIIQLSAKSSRSIHNLHVEIGDPYVFYDVIETDARGAADAELCRLAALSIADSFGLDAGALAVRCSVQPDGRSMVACATHQALLDAIKSVVVAAGRKTGRLEPAFGAFLDRHRSLFKQGNALIARQSGNFLMLGLLNEGRWQAFAAEHLADGGWSGLRDSCDAFCQRLCVADVERLPVWFEAEASDMPDDAGERWRRLPFAQSLA